jgi:hypothetical protein
MTANRCDGYEDGGDGRRPKGWIPADPDGECEAAGQLHAIIVAAQRQLMDKIRIIDLSKVWVQDGAPSMEQWVVAYFSVSLHTAREWVRTAHALAELPAIASAADQGLFSFEQLSSLTRLATPETDEDLASRAQGWTVAQTDSLAARHRAPKVKDVDDAHRARRLTWWADDHLLHLKGQLPVDQGVLLTNVLSRMASDAPPDPVLNTYEPFPARAVDALVELASLHVAEDADADRATVVVHIDAGILGGDDDAVAELEDGPRIAAETARRLACDCRWQLVAEDGNGDIVRLGRTTRSTPPWLVRQLRRRDKGCRFRGCGRTRWLHAHHVEFWGKGGSTDPDNLALLCGYHHRLIHEGGWTVTMGTGGELVFTRPDGQKIATGPPPLRPDVRRRMFGPDPPPSAA